MVRVVGDAFTPNHIATIGDQRSTTRCGPKNMTRAGLCKEPRMCRCDASRGSLWPDPTLQQIFISRDDGGVMHSYTLSVSECSTRIDCTYTIDTMQSSTEWAISYNNISIHDALPTTLNGHNGSYQRFCIVQQARTRLNCFSVWQSVII